ncbi:hypothetical protein PIB30_114493, partial [Stylosanthes scabra]|nr:hypothetical protein [Stylosanthes scabra]
MGKLVGAPQPARDQQEGRLLRWRARLDRVSVEQVRPELHFAIKLFFVMFNFANSVCFDFAVSLDSLRFTRDAGSYTGLDESTAGGAYME